MKKICLLVIPFLFLLGCATNPVLSVNTEENWAIYSISANKFYRFRDFDENGGVLQNLINEGTYEENPVAYGYTMDFLNYALVDLKSLFLDKKIPLISNEIIINSKLYGQLKEDPVLLGDKKITVENLKYFKAKNNKIPYVLGHEIKADKFLCLEFGFYKDVEKGDYSSGDLIPLVCLDAYIYDNAGNLLLKKKLVSEATSSIVLENTFYDERKFYSMFYPMVTQVIKQFGECLQ